jgi:hypothetical protein
LIHTQYIIFKSKGTGLAAQSVHALEISGKGDQEGQRINTGFRTRFFRIDYAGGKIRHVNLEVA